MTIPNMGVTQYEDTSLVVCGDLLCSERLRALNFDAGASSCRIPLSTCAAKLVGSSLLPRLIDLVSLPDYDGQFRSVLIANGELSVSTLLGIHPHFVYRYGNRSRESFVVRNLLPCNHLHYLSAEEYR